MGYLMWAITRINGRGILLALGGIYLVFATGWPFVPGVVLDPGADIVVAITVGGSALVLLAAGYWLPRTDIRPDLFGTVARWCVGAVGVILGILLFIAFVATLTNVVVNVFILTALASVAGLIMGVHDARAKTQIRNAEEKQRETKHYETIVETVSDGIFVSDGENRFTLVNQAYADMVGYDREDLLGSQTERFIDEMETPKAELRRELATDNHKPKTYEATLKTASGEQIETEATLAPLSMGDEKALDFVGVVRDVTARNERERKLHEQNERLDSFASMLAHELRNPVAVGQIYSQQLPAEADADAVEYVAEAFDRIEDMIDVMLVLTRRSDAVSKNESVVLADTARDAWDEINAPDATLDIEVNVEIRADETYLRHLFRNLFENAVEHGGKDVTITVGDLPTGFYVGDDGVGIPPEDREAVFEAGYTTAADAGGTGLGLAFVCELVDVYGWSCEINKSDAGGARFEFTDVLRDASE
ncbi:PAS domain S-box protein [Haloarcula nitratireducens]|uniref:histidine kinase n=1 Tax=Haloarcula nitratireducens TaxID=2487749 RepID=A0AAW4PLH7_9EURY|nr:PAS domain S-box protein [Halomicroarcula nitratireducens]MBX0298241.1 PAS domain S-box protein [Halomicroarcula nitratireducens]